MANGSGLTAHFLPGEIELRVGGVKVSMVFEGANPKHQVEGNGRLPGHANFLTGGESNWRVNLPLYESVIYRELYPGIDMKYGAAVRNLKSEFLVAAGADPSQIRVRYLGAGPPSVDADGSLVVSVDGRDLRERAPLVYQERAGMKTFVTGRFLVRADGTVGFRLGEYDRTLPLLIDPVLSYSTLLGGSGADSAWGVAVDASGSAYVAGFTDSLNFPATNPAQSSKGGGNDVFAAKLSPDGNALIYCTYLGGSADDRASAIAVDAQGSAYLTGSTTSRDFPMHSALQPKLAGYRNAFLVKLSPAGDSLVYGTYLGGNASDAAHSIAVDASGAAYVVGDTTSFSFPATGFQSGSRGGQDAFVAKLSADGARLVYSTYLGGSSEDRGTAIAVDGGGAAYVTGATSSADFPVWNATQRYNAGGQDAFVTRLSADGNYLLFGTFLGGSGGTVMYPEIGQAIALDTNGNAYVTGVTSSPDFPLVGALQTARKGALDAFVTKLNPSGTTVYSTYLGGSSVDVGNAIAVDAGGAGYIAGYTISTDLPVANELQSVNAGDYDAFLARVSPAGDVVQYLSYLGGTGSDSATAVALGPAATVYLAGFTQSTNFPLRNAFQSGNGGNYGAFVTKVAFSGLPSTALLSIAATHIGSFVQGLAGAGYSVIVTNQAGAPATTGIVTVTETVPAGLTLAAMSGAGWACGGTTCTRSDGLAGGVSYPAISVTVNVAADAGSPQVNQVSVSGGGSATATISDSTVIPVSLAVLLTPTPGSTLSSTSASFSWNPVMGADQYWLDVGNGVGNGGIWAGALTGSSQVVSGLPCDGRTIYVQLYTQRNSAWLSPQRYTFTVPSDCIAQITSPTPGTTLSATSVTFSRSAASGADQYWLDVGNGVGSGGLWAGALTAISQVVSGLPCDGRTLYAQLYTHRNGAWLSPQRYTYTAPAACMAQITSPSPGTTLSANGVTFSWSAASGADQYWLDVGNGVGSGGLWAGALTATSQLVSGLPCDGRTLYVQLYTHRNGAWLSPQRYTFTAPSACIAQITSPTPGTTLSDTSVTFSWSAASGADQYWLDVGNGVGSGGLWAGALTATSQLVSGLPCDGRTLYVQLYTHRNGAWLSPQRYTYTAPSACIAQITSPTPGTRLWATSVTFSWSAASGADQYWLDVDNIVGSGGLWGGALTGTSQVVGGLPCDGRTLYAQLFTHRNGAWLSPQRYTYTAKTSCAP